MSNIPPSPGRSEARLDRAIDHVVREMMHVDPRPGLRGRVLAGLATEPARAPFFARFAMAAGTLALVVLALFATLRSPETETRPPLAERQAPVLQPAPNAPIESEAAPRIAATQPAARPHAVRRRARQMTNEPIDMPGTTNVFGSRRSETAAAASLDVDEAVWPTPSQPRDEQTGALPPLVIPAVEAPVPIVVAPLNPRGPGR